MISTIKKFIRAFRYAFAREFQLQEKQARWHRRQLMRLDFEFRNQQAGFELMRRRQKFYDEGGSPSDPHCPDLYDVLADVGHKVRF